MAQKTIQGNQVLARQIRSRRIELGLTIEEASSRAGVGTKPGADMKPADPFVSTNAKEFAGH